MAALAVLVSDLPDDVLETLEGALTMSYGEGTVGIHSVGIEASLVMECISAQTDVGVPFIILSRRAGDYVQAAGQDLTDVDKVFILTDNINDFISWLNDFLGLSIPFKATVAEPAGISEGTSGDKSYGALAYENTKLQEEVSTLQDKLHKVENELGITKASLEASDKRYLALAGKSHHEQDTEIPALASKISLPAQPNAVPNLTIIASATPDSDRSMMHYVVSHVVPSDKRVVLDLTSPTTCDYYLRLKHIKTCVPWLKGESSYEDVSEESATDDRTTVVSLGFTRVSTDWLLTLDWYSLLSQFKTGVVVLMSNLSDDRVLDLFTLLSSLSSNTPLVVVRSTILNIRNASLVLLPVTYTVKLLVFGSKIGYKPTSINFPAAILIEEMQK